MSVFDCARVVLYRINQKGLEIFLVNSGTEGQEGDWQIPQGNLTPRHTDQFSVENRMIELEPVEDGKDMHQALAIECEWHEIPSIRAMIKEDVRIVKNELKNRIPGLEHGAFFAVKEAFKKVLPHEYSMLKELREVITDRNQAKSI